MSSAKVFAAGFASPDLRVLPACRHKFGTWPSGRRVAARKLACILSRSLLNPTPKKPYKSMAIG